MRYSLKLLLITFLGFSLFNSCSEQKNTTDLVSQNDDSEKNISSIETTVIPGPGGGQICDDTRTVSWSESWGLPPKIPTGMFTYAKCWSFAQKMSYKIIYEGDFSDYDYRDALGEPYLNGFNSNFFELVSSTHHILEPGYVIAWRDNQVIQHVAVVYGSVGGQIHVLHTNNTLGEDVVDPNQLSQYSLYSYVNNLYSYCDTKETYRPACLNFNGTPQPPDNPPTISGTTSNGHPKLSWPAVAGATTYKVYRKKGTANFTLLCTITGIEKIDTSINLNYIPGGTKGYVYYKVKACNSVGCSDYSSTVSYSYYELNRW